MSFTKIEISKMPWAYTIYFFDKDWKEIEELRRTNATVRDLDAVLYTMTACQRDPSHATSVWMRMLLDVAAVTVEVHRG